MASRERQLPPGRSASPRGSAAKELREPRSSPRRDMAATRALLPEPLPGLPPPLSPLDGYPKLEDLQMLLLAASGAEGAGQLSGESGEYGGEEPVTRLSVSHACAHMLQLALQTAKLHERVFYCDLNVCQ